MNIMIRRLKAIFSGSVQGVGFRFTTDRLSGHFDVTGYIKNLPNGDVELVAEGEEEIVKSFLQAIRTGPMESHIRAVQVEWGNAEGNFKSFGVEF